MTMTVDKCEHFDGKICTKCERTLPDFCQTHEEVERKARAYDEMMRTKETEVDALAELPSEPKDELGKEEGVGAQAAQKVEPKKVPLPPKKKA